MDNKQIDLRQAVRQVVCQHFWRTIIVEKYETMGFIRFHECVHCGKTVRTEFTYEQIREWNDNVGSVGRLNHTTDRLSHTVAGILSNVKA